MAVVVVVGGAATGRKVPGKKKRRKNLERVSTTGAAHQPVGAFQMRESVS